MHQEIKLHCSSGKINYKDMKRQCSQSVFLTDYGKREFVLKLCSITKVCHWKHEKLVQVLQENKLRLGGFNRSFRLFKLCCHSRWCRDPSDWGQEVLTSSKARLPSQQPNEQKTLKHLKTRSIVYVSAALNVVSMKETWTQRVRPPFLVILSKGKYPDPLTSCAKLVLPVAQTPLRTLSRLVWPEPGSVSTSSPSRFVGSHQPNVSGTCYQKGSVFFPHLNPNICT